MAEKKKAYEVSKYTARLFSRTEKYASNVEKLFSVAVDELLKMTAGSELGEDGTFSFGGNKRLSDKANRVLRGLYSSVYNEIKGDISSEWEYANLSCDELIESIFGKGLDEDNHFARWFTRNKEAMDAFFKRKSAYGGLNLSQRVWQYVGELKTEMEVALSVSLGQGDSASTVSRKVRKYLNNPDDMFRRFRVKTGEDENGNPIYGRRWKRKRINPQTGEVTWKDFNPKDYHTGRGVYRSAYKNAMRLTRTETNMAYRSSEQDRWQNMDFVLGYRVKRSNNHPDVDICDDLSAANNDNTSNHGVYPKAFVFKGWHPQCRCFVVPILASRADFVKMQKALLNGEDVPQPSGEINGVNSYLTKWIEDNAERIDSAKDLPYFLKDNGSIGKDGKYKIDFPTLEASALKTSSELTNSEHDAQSLSTIGSNASTSIAKVFSDIESIGHPEDSSPIFLMDLQEDVMNKIKSIGCIDADKISLYTSAKAITHHRSGRKKSRGKVVSKQDMIDMPRNLFSMEIYTDGDAVIFTDYNNKFIFRKDELKLKGEKIVGLNHVSSSKVIDTKEFNNKKYTKLK